MESKLDKHTLSNGMVVLGETMADVQSAAFSFMLPAGAAVLPEGCCGAANVIADWIFRGAGKRSSRELGDALDSLGLHRSSAVTSSHITIGAALEASNLAEALELYADVIRRSSLQDDQFELARQHAVDEIKALDDDPHQKVMLRLREQFYPSPIGRSTVGKTKELELLSAEKARQLARDNFNLSETIFSVAGRYDFGAVVEQVRVLFDTRARAHREPVRPTERPARYLHVENEGAQVHLGLMTRTVGPGDADYYNTRAAIAVLSGGMSARLFTEVREKRGLCYAVGARYHCLKEAAGIMCYAGTTPDKAQETLEVIMGEFNSLAEGITEEELARAKAGLKSALILQSESSTSRAAGIGNDYYMLGRVRSLDEIGKRIEQTRVDSVVEFLKKNEFRDFTVVTIGPREIHLKN